MLQTVAKILLKYFSHLFWSLFGHLFAFWGVFVSCISTSAREVKRLNSHPNGPTPVENAPTCYRAPRWSGPEFPRKIPKNTRRPEIQDPQNLPPKYPENTKKYPQNTAHLGYFFSVFGVFSGGSRISARGVFFRYFSWKFRVGPSRGSVQYTNKVSWGTPK